MWNSSASTRRGCRVSRAWGSQVAQPYADPTSKLVTRRSRAAKSSSVTPSPSNSTSRRSSNSDPGWWRPHAPSRLTYWKDWTADEQGRALHVDVGGRVHHRPRRRNRHGLGVNGERLHDWLRDGGVDPHSRRPADGPSATVFDELMATGAVIADGGPSTSRAAGLAITTTASRSSC